MINRLQTLLSNSTCTATLRLWSAKPSREFDLESFNTGDYVQAGGVLGLRLGLGLGFMVGGEVNVVLGFLVRGEVTDVLGL